MTDFTKLHLKNEYGVTAISLKNARKLIDEYGIPAFIILKMRGQEQEVIVKWNDETGLITYVFNGLTWGYIGEGPHGLQKFLEWCNINVSVEDIASWDQTKQRVIK